MKVIRNVIGSAAVVAVLGLGLAAPAAALDPVPPSAQAVATCEQNLAAKRADLPKAAITSICQNVNGICPDEQYNSQIKKAQNGLVNLDLSGISVKDINILGKLFSSEKRFGDIKQIVCDPVPPETGVDACEQKLKLKFEDLSTANINVLCQNTNNICGNEQDNAQTNLAVKGPVNLDLGKLSISDLNALGKLFSSEKRFGAIKQVICGSQGAKPGTQQE
ncbi:hypothetical protein AB0I84_04030 [Streptomyces spectabilis]|uniref:hypothetical protein n=1 Tax=Streptomyces spectabilis TaxID=68270 RepID=UPI00340EC28E